MKLLFIFLLIISTQIAFAKSFALGTHKENYVLPYSKVARAQDADRSTEFKYQFSFKIPTHGELNRTGLYFAYSQKSFWQAYDKKDSNPYRETNYNPEAFYSIMWGKDSSFDFGYEHESNGKSNPESRSWDRLNAKLNFNFEYFYGYFKTWYMLKEDQNKPRIQQKNKSIQYYYGKKEVKLGLKLGNIYLTTLGRYSFTSNKGFLEITTTYPLNNVFSFMLQHTQGYGDSLLDYNHNIKRYSIGVMIFR